MPNTTPSSSDEFELSTPPPGANNTTDRTIKRHTWPSIPEAEKELIRRAEALTGRTLPRKAVTHLVYDLGGQGHAVYSDALLVTIAELWPSDRGGGGMKPLQIPATDLGEYDPRQLEITNDEALGRLQEAAGEVSDALARHRAVDLGWLTNILESCQVLLSAAQRRALPEVGLVAMANDCLGDVINLLGRCIVGLQKEAAQESDQESAQETLI